MFSEKCIHANIYELIVVEACITYSYELFLTCKKMFSISFQDKVLINQWKDEILNGFKTSTQIMATMNKKASKMYGADLNNPNPENFRPPLEHRNSNGS